MTLVKSKKIKCIWNRNVLRCLSWSSSYRKERTLNEVRSDFLEQLKPTDCCPLRHHAPANCQLYLLSTPLPLKPGMKSSVLSIENRAHYHSDRMTRLLLLLAPPPKKRVAVVSYLLWRPPHWSTFSQYCFWPHSGTGLAAPASHGDSERWKCFGWSPAPNRRWQLGNLNNVYHYGDVRCITRGFGYHKSRWHKFHLFLS